MSFAPAVARLRWKRCRGVPRNTRCCNTYAPEPKTSNAIGCVGQKLRKQTARSMVPPNVDSRYGRALNGGSNPGADEWRESALPSRCRAFLRRSLHRPFADPLLAHCTGTLLSSQPTPGQAADHGFRSSQPILRERNQNAARPVRIASLISAARGRCRWEFAASTSPLDIMS